jgi:hypothetical protein
MELTNETCCRDPCGLRRNGVCGEGYVTVPGFLSCRPTSPRLLRPSGGLAATHFAPYPARHGCALYFDTATVAEGIMSSCESVNRNPVYQFLTVRVNEP